MLHNSRKIAAVDGVVFASALLVNVASALLITWLATSVLSSPSTRDNFLSDTRNCGIHSVPEKCRLYSQRMDQRCLCH